MQIDSYHGYRINGLDWLEYKEEDGLPVETGSSFVQSIVEWINREGVDPAVEAMENGLNVFLQLGDPFGGFGSTSVCFTYIVDLDSKVFELYNGEYSPVYSYNQSSLDLVEPLVSIPLAEIVAFYISGKWHEMCGDIKFDLLSVPSEITI